MRKVPVCLIADAALGLEKGGFGFHCRESKHNAFRLTVREIRELIKAAYECGRQDALKEGASERLKAVCQDLFPETGNHE